MRSQFQTALNFIIKVLEVSHEFLDLRFSETLPDLVGVFVLEGLEEGELLEKSFPRQMRVGRIIRNGFADRRGLLKFGEHHMPGVDIYCISGVHRRESWSYDGHLCVVVSLGVI